MNTVKRGPYLAHEVRRKLASGRSSGSCAGQSAWHIG